MNKKASKSARTKASAKWDSKVNERINIKASKEKIEQIKNHALNNKRDKSVNAFVLRACETQIKIDNEEIPKDGINEEF